jgi:RNA polymerase sigma-70 factor (ECF subfamily)
MVRITQATDGQSATRLRVEGRITDRDGDALRAACAAHLDTPKALMVDLAGVSFVDAPGASALRDIERRGALLVGRSGFVDQVLRTAPARAREHTDEDPLVARLRAGDELAFETMVRRHGGRMLRTARRLLRNEEAARDAVQDAFLAAFSAIDRFDGRARLSTWLHRIVVNYALMRLRRQRRRPEESIEELLPRFTDEGHWIAGTAQWNGTCDALLERKQSRALVRECIDGLPEKFRTVIVLRDIEELDTQEAAELLGTTPNALKIRLHRARQALRTLIERRLALPADTIPISVGRAGNATRSSNE